MSALRVVACGLIGASACVGTETGNPVQDREQEVHLAYAPLATQLALTDGTQVTVDGVAVELSRIVLERCGGAGEGDATLVRARELDLLAAEADVARVPAARYCALRFALGGEGDRFSASRATANGETNVAFESQLQLAARLRLLEPLELGDQPAYWIVGVDLGEWIEPLEPWLTGEESAFSAGGDDAALGAAIIRSIALYKDVDRDTEADEGELVAPISEAESAEAQIVPAAKVD